jgi:hypothetical protein
VIVRLSKFRRPAAINCEPSRDSVIARYPAQADYHTILRRFKPAASCGGAYANRPKLRGRKIAGRTYGRPPICVPSGLIRRRGSLPSEYGKGRSYI